MPDDLTYSEVLQDAEPAMDGHDSPPRVEVFEQTKERRKRRRVYKSKSWTSYRFHVVDHERKAVVCSTRWSTNDHHNPYGEVKARAFGEKHGYKAGLRHE